MWEKGIILAMKVVIGIALFVAVQMNTGCTSVGGACHRVCDAIEQAAKE